MYKEHPNFKSIPDNAKIWRFMDFAKFCTVLEKKALFFANPDSFQDPWEGYLPRQHYDESVYADLSGDIKKLIINTSQTVTKNVRKEMGISCWHINDHESEAFWRSYAGRGVVIQSTFGRLKDAFKDNKEYEIHIGEVEYKDPEKDFVNIKNAFNYVMWKRASFKYESELRAIIWARADSGTGARPFDDSRGQNVILDLNALIENVYTTPFERELWFNDLVSIIIKKYGFNFPCKKSILMDLPY